MGELRIMGRVEGDKEYKWRQDRPKQVAKAQKAFDEAIAAGGRAYKVVTEQVTKRGKEIKKFDPTLEHIIITAPMAGG